MGIHACDRCYGKVSLGARCVCGGTGVLFEAATTPSPSPPVPRVFDVAEINRFAKNARLVIEKAEKARLQQQSQRVTASMPSSQSVLGRHIPESPSPPDALSADPPGPERMRARDLGASIGTYLGQSSSHPVAQVMTLLGYGIGRLIESIPGPVVTLSKLPAEPKQWDLVEVGFNLFDSPRKQPARKKLRRKKRRKSDRET